ncbi:MAG: hypothetical protein K8S55_07340, partial [Phycisphaerae bacterium]|nr:hypothetical protein [Phycisphaerae bacterium]
MKRVIGLTIVIMLMPFVLFAEPDAPPLAAKETKKPVTVTIPGMGKLAVTGPFVHKNLTFFVFHDPAQPQEEPDYITLAAGTKAGLVKISEDKSA